MRVPPGRKAVGDDVFGARGSSTAPRRTLTGNLPDGLICDCQRAPPRTSDQAGRVDRRRAGLTGSACSCLPCQLTAPSNASLTLSRVNFAPPGVESAHAEMPGRKREVDVAAWLREMGLGQYEQAFNDNAVDDEVLPRLTADDLKDLGVVAIGHRRKLLDASRHWGHTRQRWRPRRELEGERRQVTVVFADLAGYTALSRELDAEEVHALLERFFTCADRLVAEHGGRIDKHVGDCVMAVFGAPVAHGNDAERAVRAALAIRDAMPTVAAEAGRPVRVHIGVAGGEVVASGTGSVTPPRVHDHGRLGEPRRATD